MKKIGDDKGLVLAVIASLLIDLASKHLKKDNIFYKYKNKKLLNELIDSNKEVLKNIDKLRKLIGEGYFNNIEEKDVIEDNFNTEEKVFFNFIKLFYESDETKLIELNMFLDNLIKGKRLYTQEEYDIKGI